MGKKLTKRTKKFAPKIASTITHRKQKQAIKEKRNNSRRERSEEKEGQDKPVKSVRQRFGDAREKASRLKRSKSKNAGEEEEGEDAEWGVDEFSDEEELENASEDELEDEDLDGSEDEDDLDDIQLANDEDDSDLDEEDGEEVMEGGGSDDEGDIEEEIEKHRRELLALQNSDPEFFHFLKSQDSGMLDFGDEGKKSKKSSKKEAKKSKKVVEDEEDLDDDDLDNLELDEDEIGEYPEVGDEEDLEDDEEVADDDEDEEIEGAQDDDDEEGDDGDDDEEDQEEKANRSEEKCLTMETFNKWKKDSLRGKNLVPLKKVVLAFKRAARLTEGDSAKDADRDTSSQSFTIKTGPVFNAVVSFSLHKMSKCFDLALGINRAEDMKSRKLPKDSKRWKNVKVIVKSFLISYVHFLSQLTEPSMISIFLHWSQKLIPYFACNKTAVNSFLRELTQIWSQSQEKAVRDIALVNIYQLAIITPYPFIEKCMKGVYLNFVKNCKFTNSKTAEHIDSLIQGVVEIFGIDFNISYQLGFVYLRQLTILLRTAINSTTKESIQKVYGWQYINSMRAIGKILSSYPNQEDLKHLIYPFVEVALGTIRLIPGAKYFPLRLIMTKTLMEISRSNDIYIPISPYLLEILSNAELKKRTKPTGKATSALKDLDLACTLKAGKSVFESIIFKDEILSEAISQLIEFYAQYSTSIGFPELIVPAITPLKEFASACRNPVLKRSASSIVEKLISSADLITAQRRQLDVGPKDVPKSQLTRFSSNKKTPIQQLYAQNLTKLAELKSLQRSKFLGNNKKGQSKGGNKKRGDDDEDDDDDDDEEEYSKPAKKAVRGKENQKGGNEVAAKKPAAKKAKGKKRVSIDEKGIEADVLKDLVLSDDE